MERLSYRIIPMPHPLIYDGSEEEIKDFSKLDKEFDDIQDIVNENYRSAWECMRNLYEYEDRAIDLEGLPKKQHKYAHFLKDSLRPETCDWQWKPFITDTMFWTVNWGINVGMQLQWGQNGNWLVNSTIWWTPHEDGAGSMRYTSTINSGFQRLPGIGGAIRYMYIRPREDYLFGAHNLGTTLVPALAMRDGRLCLFMGQQTHIGGVAANLDPEYTLYGGGLHLMR